MKHCLNYSLSNKIKCFKPIQRSHVVCLHVHRCEERWKNKLGRESKYKIVKILFASPQGQVMRWEDHPSRKQTGLYVMNGPSKNINIRCNAKILPCYLSGVATIGGGAVQSLFQYQDPERNIIKRLLNHHIRAK